jgi:hypothetical protein
MVLQRVEGKIVLHCPNGRTKLYACRSCMMLLLSLRCIEAQCKLGIATFYQSRQRSSQLQLLDA